MGIEKDSPALRSSHFFVAVASVLVGLLTFSLSKALVTYAFSSVAVAGVLLPDWDFFDRDFFADWLKPMPIDPPPIRKGPHLYRMKVYPLRLALFVTTYSFAAFKWWSYISN